jgi:vacuolar-type H+-ATPase catalytic subunit A/Vma1
MRKLIIGCALAASALTIAAPAAAQYYPQQQTYGSNQGYNQGYNQNYGYNQNNRGDARILIARVDQVRQQIRQLGRSGALSRQEAYRLDAEAQQLRNQVRQSAYNGIDQREQWQLQRQIQRLEQRVSRNATDRNGRYGRGSGFGNQNQYGQQYGNWQNRDGDRRDGDREDRDND